MLMLLSLLLLLLLLLFVVVFSHNQSHPKGEIEQTITFPALLQAENLHFKFA